ncbi:MAG: ATP-grasp domain-containing protein [Candidatus Zixiibacteriota bacterium]
MENKKLKILVTDGNQRSTLALVRSLGARDIALTVGEDEHPSLSSKSKYCSNTYKYSSPKNDPEKFVADIENEIKRGEYFMLIPMTDLTCFLVMQNFERFSRYTKIPFPDQGNYWKAQDKGIVVSLFKNLGFGTPLTWISDDGGSLESFAENVNFPVVIKPRQSKILIDNKWISGQVRYAYSLDQLKHIIENYDRSAPPPMVQERIYGPGAGAFMLFNRGELRASFFHRRLREKPPSGGVSVLCESIPIHNEMLESATAVLKKLKWHGVAMAEYKIDLRDNKPKIMEINTRFWGSLQLAVDAGVDFPFLLYKMLADGDIEYFDKFKIGIKVRWLLGDLDHLLLRLFKGAGQLNLPSNYPGRFKTFLNFINFFGKDIYYSVFRKDDLGPAFFELKQYLKNLFS